MKTLKSTGRRIDPSGTPILSHSSHSYEGQLSPSDVHYKGNWPWVLQEFISHPYAYNLAISRQWGKLAKALLGSIATYSHYLVIINGFFPLLDHSCICCLAAVYAPEAWKKFGKKHFEIRKHSRIENIFKYFGYSRKYANWPIFFFHEIIKFLE